MKTAIINLLPEYFGHGEVDFLKSGGIWLFLGCWGVLFLFLGLFLGALFMMKARKAIATLEKENKKGFNRLEIYRATVEKQSESELLKS